MRNYIKANVVGQLTADAEKKTTTDGTPYVVMNVAVNRNSKDANGEWKNEVTYVRAICKERLDKEVEDVLIKGTRVSLDGMIEISEYNGKPSVGLYGVDGRTAKVLAKIVSEGNGAAAPAVNTPAPKQSSAKAKSAPKMADIEDLDEEVSY